MTSAELIDCRKLGRGSRIDVETKSRHYLIECVGTNAFRISGHPEFCPEPVTAELRGSIDVEGVLEPGLIGRGMRMQFSLDDRHPITTSRVLSVHVEAIRPSASGPISSIN